jgi:probable rRNA maturation factor
VRLLAGCRGRVRPGELRRIAAHVLDAERLDPGVEVEVVLAGALTMRDLNRLYRGRDEETDVLSFSAREGEPFVGSPDEAPSLGEVIVCLPVAERQAGAAGRPVAGEVAHLLTHGLLHLLGYDHEEAAGAARMRSREDALLSALGYAGQYEHGH